MKVITFGTFDLIHIGHINILEKCKQFKFDKLQHKLVSNIKHNDKCTNELIVGISSDNFSYEKKSKYPIYNQTQRKKILESVRFVDKVFIEDSFEKKNNTLSIIKQTYLLWEMIGKANLTN